MVVYSFAFNFHVKDGILYVRSCWSCERGGVPSLSAAVGRYGVRGIGSLALAYGGALAVRCALSVCCIAPNYVVYVVYPHRLVLR